MADNSVTYEGKVYPDEVGMVVENHPYIPDELKTVFRTPPEASTEPAGASKPEEGTKTPQKGFLDRLSIVNAVRGMSKGAEESVKNLPENLSSFYDTVKNAFGLAHDVYGGKIDPMSEQGIERSFDLASMMVFGPAPVAGKLADGTFGSFAGVRGMDAKKFYDLKEAKFLESKGIHPDKIYQDTGMFKDLDGKWRFEIDDSKATYKPEWYNKPAYTPADSSTPKLLEDQMKDLFKQVPYNPYEGKTATTLGEILDHPELYKSYPRLKDVPVVKDLNVQTAHWDPNLQEIHIGPEEYNTKTTIMHEVQHAIQDEEGFAKGGSPGQAGKTYTLKLAKDFKEQVEQPLRKIYDKISKGGIATDEDLLEVKRLTPIAEKYKEYAAAGDAAAYENYMKMAGEIESRNVEARLYLNEEQRRRLHPGWTTDRLDPIISNTPALTTPYGIKKGRGSSAPEKPNLPANDNDVFGKKDFKSYNQAVRDQEIKRELKLEGDIHVGDFKHWRDLAVKEKITTGLTDRPNAVSAARKYSEGGKTTVLIREDGRRIVFKDGLKVGRDSLK